MAEKKIVVIGAGVAGLTTALLLSRNSSYKITVAAKHMPGDYDIEYASPWAGANYMPVSVKGSAAADWDRNTWPILQDLAQNHPEAGIHFQRTEIYDCKEDTGSATVSSFAGLLSPKPWFQTLFSDFQEIPKDHLMPGVNNAATFTSVCINTAIYLPYLVSECLRAGVVFRRKIFNHVCDARSAHHSGKGADLVVNCTGLFASRLGGVEDKSVIPARGQIVLVMNDPGAMFLSSGTNEGSDEITYIMMRAAGGGTVLGGSYEKGCWDPQVDPDLATRIMKRCVELCPQLTSGRGIEHLDIIRHGVGLRPSRLGGTRIEKEKIEETWVVHNYGHGGFGYQSSYGCSQIVVRLADDVLQGKARL